MSFFSSLDSTKFSYLGEKISQNFDSTKLEKENKRNEPCFQPLFSIQEKNLVHDQETCAAIRYKCVCLSFTIDI